MKKFLATLCLILAVISVALGCCVFWMANNDWTIMHDRERYFIAGVELGGRVQTEHPELNPIQRNRVAWDYFQSLNAFMGATDHDWHRIYFMPDDSYSLPAGSPMPDWQAELSKSSTPLAVEEQKPEPTDQVSQDSSVFNKP